MSELISEIKGAIDLTQPSLDEAIGKLGADSGAVFVLAGPMQHEIADDLDFDGILLKMPAGFFKFDDSWCAISDNGAFSSPHLVWVKGAFTNTSKD